ncbi:hypothetical protein DFR33_1085 [Bradymonas sediminis]|uniref:Uncharacterized protein n=1 Tax=Bradymonas sediminis TaxID=1548548 RepID=A0A2Z4FIY9_9DELT|nr:hypothetical protein DN745_05350 [Bradymonas sediminis]TDP71793.1 hypothetical protein DFR33_1085 [Bradymonas sediminis]
MTENIELYPAAETVFKDPALGVYFRPRLTFETTNCEQIYRVHLLGTDGLICANVFKYLEHNFFGFKYDDGLYDFLGDLRSVSTIYL